MNLMTHNDPNRATIFRLGSSLVHGSRSSECQRGSKQVSDKRFQLNDCLLLSQYLYGSVESLFPANQMMIINILIQIFFSATKDKNTIYVFQFLFLRSSLHLCLDA